MFPELNTSHNETEKTENKSGITVMEVANQYMHAQLSNTQVYISSDVWWHSWKASIGTLLVYSNSFDSELIFINTLMNLS